MQALWMLLASFLFALMGACAKFAIEHGASMTLVVLLRGLPSVVLLALWAYSRKLSFQPRAWKPHFWRNLTGVTSVWLGFYAVASLPLGTATSLNYTAPLFIAGWVLISGGSKKDPLCIAAVGFGFLGVLAVLQPSITVDQIWPACLGLTAGALAAAAMLQIRAIGRLGEPAWRTVLFFSVVVCLTGVVGTALSPWRQVDWLGWIALFAVGITGMFAQLALTRAYGTGSTLLNAALQYTTIIFAALMGVWFWDEVMDRLAVFGVVCIISAGLLSIWRTAQDKSLK